MQQRTPGISPTYYKTIGFGLDTEQGQAYAAAKKMIDKYCGKVKNALDYGCGPGRSSRFLKASADSVLGVDVHPEAIVEAKKLPQENISYQLIQNGKLKFPVRFDLTFSGLVLLEVSNKKEISQILENLHKATTPDGTIIILTCTKAGYINDGDKWKCLLTEEEKESLKDGDSVPTGMTDSDEEFIDYYWSNSFYKNAFRENDLQLIETLYASPLEKNKKSRYVIYVCKKSKLET